MKFNSEVFYYTKDGKRFHSRIESALYAQKTQQQVFFHYYDNVYNFIDWQIEPPQSLNFYYKEQATRIRDNYDYVVLFYSGGADSTNILETFYYNNIKIDKIVMVGAFSQDPNSYSDKNHNAELYLNAFSRIDKLGLASICQLCDYSKMFSDVKQFRLYQLGEEWTEEIIGRYSPHNWFWYEIEDHVVPTQMKDKKVALIWGKDKPIFSSNRVNNKESSHSFTFMDRTVLNYGTGMSIKPHENIDRINFYWDPNYTDILVKQLFTLIHCEKQSTSIEDKLYKLRTPILYKSPKSQSIYLSLRDTYLIDNVDTKLFDFYRLGLKSIQNKIGLLQLGTPIYTQKYYIGN